MDPIFGWVLNSPFFPPCRLRSPEGRDHNEHMRPSGELISLRSERDSGGRRNSSRLTTFEPGGAKTVPTVAAPARDSPRRATRDFSARAHSELSFIIKVLYRFLTCHGSYHGYHGSYTFLQTSMLILPAIDCRRLKNNIS